MKKLFLTGILLINAVVAQARIVTLLVTGTNQTATLIVQENESVKLLGGYDGYWENVQHAWETGAIDIQKAGTLFRWYAQWYGANVEARTLAIAGPAIITLNSGVTNRLPAQSVFVSFEVQPENYDVNKSVTIAPGTAGAGITLESSTNLINWVSATNGIYTNVPSATFFRIKAERLP